MKTHGIIQARIGSTRLPGKVLLNLGGKLLLQRVIERAKDSKKIQKIVVATTIKPQDDKIADFCNMNNLLFFRGSESDVLARYIEAANKYGSEVVVRITADNPFTDPTLLDQLIEKHEKENNDYTFGSGFPIGSVCEVFNIESLKKVQILTDISSYHEHLGTYFLDNPSKFKVGVLNAPEKLRFPEIRLTVDTKGDFQTAENLINFLGEKFNLEDIIKIWKEKREIFINTLVEQSYPNNSIKDLFSGKKLLKTH